jgi:hypothetical protein
MSNVLFSYLLLLKLRISFCLYDLFKAFFVCVYIPKDTLQELIMHIEETRSAIEARRVIVHGILAAAKKTLLIASESLPSCSPGGMDRSPPSSRSLSLTTRSVSHDIREVRKIVAFDKVGNTCF